MISLKYYTVYLFKKEEKMHFKSFMKYVQLTSKKKTLVICCIKKGVRLIFFSSICKIWVKYIMNNI